MWILYPLSVLEPIPWILRDNLNLGVFHKLHGDFQLYERKVGQCLWLLCYLRVNCIYFSSENLIFLFAFLWFELQPIFFKRSLLFICRCKPVMMSQAMKIFSPSFGFWSSFFKKKRKKAILWVWGKMIKKSRSFFRSMMKLFCNSLIHFLYLLFIYGDWAFSWTR